MSMTQCECRMEFELLDPVCECRIEFELLALPAELVVVVDAAGYVQAGERERQDLLRDARMRDLSRS